MEPLSHSHPGSPSFPSSPFHWPELTPGKGGGGGNVQTLVFIKNTVLHLTYAQTWRLHYNVDTDPERLLQRPAMISFLFLSQGCPVRFERQKELRMKQNECKKGALGVPFEVLSSLPQYCWTLAFIPLLHQHSFGRFSITFHSAGVRKRILKSFNWRVVWKKALSDFWLSPRFSFQITLYS